MLHYFFFAILSTFFSYVVFGFKYDYSNLWFFFAYLKYKYTMGDFWDYTMINLLLFGFVYDLMENSMSIKTEQYTYILSLVCSHFYFFFYFALPSTLSFEKMKLPQGETIQKILERINVENLDSKNYEED